MEARKPYDIDRLTDVALRVFAERGYDGASMDDVARAAGITKAGIYHHVAAKEALLERGLRRALDALFAIAEEPEAREGAAVRRLEHIVHRVVEATFTLLPELTVLFRVRANSPVTREAVERRRAFDRLVAGLIRQAQVEGAVAATFDPAVAARLIFGMSNSLVEWYHPGGQLGPAQIAAAVENLVFHGLRGARGGVV